jgi:aspartyl-tRNA(Asn)/glutamyl-tRNA(Gln) amidotransferase subunit A
MATRKKKTQAPGAAAPRDLCDLPLHTLHARRQAGEITTADVARSVLARIEAVEPRVHAFITLTTEGVLARAEEADARLAQGTLRSPIDGLPLALKDIFTTRGIQTTCGSRILEGFVPPYDATVVEHLRERGLNLVGKTNMDEFAMGSSTENSGYGPTHNPWDLSRVPGGSSGGSAAAVAAGEALAALGTDTGGSIRQPAAFTSLVGLKPTYGRVSRYGMVAFASSLDQAGVMTRDTEDAALLLGMIAGPDPRDATSAQVPVPDYRAALGGDLKGKRIGLVREFQAWGGVEPVVAETFQANVQQLQALGAEVREVSLPSLDYGIAVYYILAPSEASSNLGRYDGVRYGPRAGDASGLREMFQRTRERGFGPEVKRRIMLGTFALSAGYYDAYYLRAMRIREQLRADFLRAFQEVHLIACPPAPMPAFKLGEKLDDPLQMYLVDAFTLPVNLAGLPGISVPAGFTPEGLPLGLQLIAPHFQEAALLQAAHAFEQATPHHDRRPPLG